MPWGQVFARRALAAVAAAGLVKHHPELLRAEFGLSEVGGYNIEFAGKPVYLVQVAEKGTCWLRVRAHGRPGHGSLPHSDNAVVHLARQLTRLAAEGMPYRLTDAAAGFLQAASRAAGGPLGELLLSLKYAGRGRARVPDRAARARDAPAAVCHAAQHRHAHRSERPASKPTSSRPWPRR